MSDNQERAAEIVASVYLTLPQHDQLTDRIADALDEAEARGRAEGTRAGWDAAVAHLIVTDAERYAPAITVLSVEADRAAPAGQDEPRRAGR